MSFLFNFCFSGAEGTTFIRFFLSFFFLRPSSDAVLHMSRRMLKAGFHMIADDRGSRIADRRSQKVLRSSAIIWKHTSAIVCDLAIVIAVRRRSQTIAEDRTMFYLLRSSAIVCDRLRSIAIVLSYGNQSSAICDRNVSHSNLYSDP